MVTFTETTKLDTKIISDKNNILSSNTIQSFVSIYGVNALTDNNKWASYFEARTVVPDPRMDKVEEEEAVC